MFDKKTDEWSCPAIKRVAQERDYFSPETEDLITRKVEHPGHRALEALRSGDALTDDLLSDLVIYIAVQLMRVPRKRRKGIEGLPGVLKQTIAKLKSESLALRESGNEARIEHFLSELDRIAEKYRTDPPDSVIEQIHSPWPSDRIAGAVVEMAWRHVHVPQGHFLITSDNPAYFFESLGLGRPESELTFPLASNMAVLGSRQGQQGAVFEVVARPHLVKEINRRIACGAERFIFSSRRTAWIPIIARRKEPMLSRIQW